ncbi:hypothetical protein RTBOTA2_005791 [Rhodotorula toruloides]|uniref:Uncharacterized protein n=1 Tax=Rhodotorula toruloides TaxID=5286 RepID=A0A2T0A2A2_RHOTO|nr:hypothetical protein RTBOTA2_005791 [Rhodotorula toruloides]PRQ72134.1 hypothetical protein AAT19DRAFT_9473 [Rhodotorula toruloides]
MPNRQSLRRFRTKLGEVFGAVSASFSSRHGAFSTAFKTGVENVVGERCWGPNGTLSDAQAARVYDRLAYDAHLISLIDWTSLTIQTTTVAHFVGIICGLGEDPADAISEAEAWGRHYGRILRNTTVYPTDADLTICLTVTLAVYAEHHGFDPSSIDYTWPQSVTDEVLQILGVNDWSLVRENRRNEILKKARDARTRFIFPTAEQLLGHTPLPHRETRYRALGHPQNRFFPTARRELGVF